MRFLFVIARIAVTGGAKTGRNEWKVDADGLTKEGRQTDGWMVVSDVKGASSDFARRAAAAFDKRAQKRCVRTSE